MILWVHTKLIILQLQFKESIDQLGPGRSEAFLSVYSGASSLVETDSVASWQQPISEATSFSGLAFSFGRLPEEAASINQPNLANLDLLFVGSWTGELQPAAGTIAWSDGYLQDIELC